MHEFMFHINKQVSLPENTKPEFVSSQQEDETLQSLFYPPCLGESLLANKELYPFPASKL